MGKQPQSVVARGTPVKYEVFDLRRRGCSQNSRVPQKCAGKRNEMKPAHFEDGEEKGRNIEWKWVANVEIIIDGIKWSRLFFEFIYLNYS